MTETEKQELLKEAKRRYPPGTRHSGYHGKDYEFIVKGNLYWSSGNIYSADCQGCIYEGSSKTWGATKSLILEIW